MTLEVHMNKADRLALIARMTDIAEGYGTVDPSGDTYYDLFGTNPEDGTRYHICWWLNEITDDSDALSEDYDLTVSPASMEMEVSE